MTTKRQGKKSCKQSEENHALFLGGKTIKMTMDFSSGIMEAKKKW